MGTEFLLLGKKPSKPAGAATSTAEIALSPSLGPLFPTARGNALRKYT
jgi:hypothetical protein